MRGRHYPREWELRDPRFEELDSEDDDIGQGVILDPNSYANRDARARGGFVSDELYFDGHDIGQHRLSRRNMYDFEDEFDSRELEYRDREGMAYQAAVREKEEDMLQSALERIARARAKGKTSVRLSDGEREAMDAFERRKGQPPEQPKPPLASPPATPAKPAAKGKVGSRSNSQSSLASKARKRNSGLFGSSPSPAKSNSKAKVNRTPYPTGQAATSGMMVTGPNGVPVYAPIAYHSSQSQELVRVPSQPSSKAPSRSGSKHRRRESTPPERAETYSPYPPRYYLPPANMRPESSGSNRSLPDDIDWYPPAPRHRSTSNAQYGGYPSDYDYPPSSLPAAQGGRRNFSGPAEVRYSNVPRRVMPPPGASRPVPTHHSQSDPALPGRKTSGLSREIAGDSSTSRSSSSSGGEDDDEEEEGVQVDILPDEGEGGTGYSISRAPITAAPSGNEGRKRRGGRR